MKSMKLVGSGKLLALSFVAAAISAGVAPSALAKGQALLVKSIVSVAPSGKSDSMICEISADAVSVRRTIAGVDITEERSVTVAPEINNLISKTVGMTNVTKPGTGSAIGESYSFQAASASGQVVILQSYDHATGVSTSIEDLSAYQLMKITNTLCPLR